MGGDLQAEICSWAAQPHVRPAWPQLLRIFKEVVEGVNALHSKILIHRDLKPANIFISADHKHAKVGDLGLATNVGRGRGTGTPGYIAPEVWSSKEYSTRADNWSLGCVLMDLAYPTALGGWSVKNILQQHGHAMD